MVTITPLAAFLAALEALMAVAVAALVGMVVRALAGQPLSVLFGPVAVVSSQQLTWGLK